MGEGTFWAQLVILMGVLGGFWYQNHRAERQRKWDIEDRRATAETLAAEVKQKADALAVKAEQRAEALATKVEETAAGVKHDFDVAKEEIVTKADRAFHESNSLNAKLRAVTVSNNNQFEELLRAAMPTDALDTIDKTTTETAKKVDEIHHELTAEAERRNGG